MRVLLSLVVLACVVSLVGLPVCTAHNWLTSPSRANHVNDRGDGDFNGYTNPPCPTKGSRVHTQVGPGQKFQVEWASGHGYGSFTYLTLIRAVDEYRMNEQTREVLDDYIKTAPPGSDDLPNDKAYHVTDNGPSNDASLAQDITATFQRPALFRRMTNPRIYLKTAEATKNDRRVRYNNPKYPWIISVHKFALNEDRSEQMDGVMMAVPADLPSGQYIVQYQWSGYYDCVDVNVLSEQSIDLYGGTPAQSVKEMDKLNHCLYTPTLRNFKAFDNECFELADGDTIDTCANACFFNSFQYDYCDAVVVSPVRLNRDVAKFGGTFPGGSHLPASCANALAKLRGNPDTAQVCYTVKAGDTPIVGPPYKVVSDPEDPVFYSTCYQKRSQWVYKQSCPACTSPAPPADFRFADRCISCADMNRNFFTKAVPRWTTTSMCEHCDIKMG